MNVLETANSLVHGDRGAAYGHPLDDYECTAKIWSAILSQKLKADITPEEAILCMIGVKLSRESRNHKLDNLIDAAGYAECAAMCVQERARRQLNMLEDRFP